jgi:hypothetical protein
VDTEGTETTRSFTESNRENAAEKCNGN